ncbi:MAG: DoxX family protein [Bacteroidota bacterium]
MSTYQLIGLAFAAVGVLTLGVFFWERQKQNSLKLQNLPLTNMLTWITRIMVGVLFIYSGFVKANDYIGFGYKLEEYFMVFGEHFSFMKGFWDFWVPLAEPLAWFISVFEIALAFAIMVGWRMNLTMWLTLLMMVFFTVLTAYSHVTGAVTDCGCFGDALKLTPFESFMKDVILMITITPLFLVRKSIRPVPNNMLASLIVAISFLGSGVYSYYCHEHLPVIDYRPYKAGVDLNICTTEEGPDGIPKCKDWFPYFPQELDYIKVDSVMNGDTLTLDSTKVFKPEPVLFEGKTLMIIFYDALKADGGALDQSVALVQTMRGSDIQIVGATATGPSEMKTVVEKYGINYRMGYLDQTVLKTVIRSHPGYMLLNDGVVIKKWHANDIPDRAELESLLP